MSTSNAAKPQLLVTCSSTCTCTLGKRCNSTQLNLCLKVFCVDAQVTPYYTKVNRRCNYSYHKDKSSGNTLNLQPKKPNEISSHHLPLNLPTFFAKKLHLATVNPRKSQNDQPPRTFTCRRNSISRKKLPFDQFNIFSLMAKVDCNCEKLNGHKFDRATWRDSCQDEVATGNKCKKQ